MALIICKDCKKEFSDDAKRCPHCGAKKLNDHKVLKGIGIAICFLWAIGKINSPAPIPSTETASYMCKDFVKQSLHDPDSADFDDWTHYFSEQEKNDIFHVQVTLRAKNGFNALRKMVVDCKVTKTPSNKWVLVKLKELKQ